MMDLLPMLVVGASALAAPAEPVSESTSWLTQPVVFEHRRDRKDREDREPKVVLRPLRLSSRAAIRNGAVPGGVFELGSQVVRTEQTAIDLNVGFTTLHALDIGGQLWRQMASADVSADLAWLPNPWLAAGPTAGVSYRWFTQQWTFIDDAWIPFIGVHASSDLIRARKWSVELVAKGLLDLAGVQMVLETQEVVTLSPGELQIGVRINFGHGKVRSEVTP